jgi:hypothetical protein
VATKAWAAKISSHMHTLPQGIKLRNVNINERELNVDMDEFLEIDETWPLYAWDDPRLCFGRLRLEIVNYGDGDDVLDQEFKRMRAIDLRGAKGISFHWGEGLVAVGAHTSDRDLSPYESRTVPYCSGVDIYVPLEDTETVKEIWTRRGDEVRYPVLKARLSPLPPKLPVLNYHEHPKLTRPQLVTSYARTIIIGPQLKRLHERSEHKLLAKKCSRFFADTGPDGMTMIAFEDARPKQPSSRGPPRYPRPLSPYPGSIDGDDIMYTYADLEGTCAVQPCYGASGGVSGLMLHDRDGRRFCVGEVHLGRMEAALEVGTASGMSFYFSMFKGRYPYVHRIEMMGQEGDGSGDNGIDGDGSITVQWSGLLEWWVSDRQCKLHYLDQTSPPLADFGETFTSSDED